MLEAIGKPKCQISTEDLRGFWIPTNTVALDNVDRILSYFFSWL